MVRVQPNHGRAHRAVANTFGMQHAEVSVRSLESEWPFPIGCSVLPTAYCWKDCGLCCYSVCCPLPPRAASSAFTSATMRAMAASSAAVVILAARALAMLSLARAAPRRALAKQSCQRNEPDRFSTHHPGELSGGPHPIYLHLLEAWF